MADNEDEETPPERDVEVFKNSLTWAITSQFQNRPSPTRAILGHLTRVKLRTVRNLTQNEARPVGHLTFVSKLLSVVGSKTTSQFFDSVR